MPGLIHTCWSRASTLRPLYGPLEGWLPLMDYAADSGESHQNHLAGLMDRVDAAIYSRGLLADDEDVEPLREELRQRAGAASCELDSRCWTWWELAVEYAALRNAAFASMVGRRSLETTRFYRGADGHMLDTQRSGRSRIISRITEWQQRASSLWRRWNLSDGEEFFESRSGVLLDLMTR